MLQISQLERDSVSEGLNVNVPFLQDYLACYKPYGVQKIVETRMALQYSLLILVATNIVCRAFGFELTLAKMLLFVCWFIYVCVLLILNFSFDKLLTLEHHGGDPRTQAK